MGPPQLAAMADSGQKEEVRIATNRGGHSITSGITFGYLTARTAISRSESDILVIQRTEQCILAGWRSLR